MTDQWWSAARQQPGGIPFRSKFDAARDPLTARNAIGAVDAKFVTDAIAAAGGGGGGAPTTAEYITAAADATLSAERVLTNTATVTWDFATAGQAKANVTVTGYVPTTRLITAGAGLTGGGDLSADRTVDVGAGTGITVNANDVALTVPVSVANGGTGSITAGGALTSLGAQPLDATLTALAAYNTNGLLTQTAADTFTGRTLTGPAAGITVSNGNGVAGNPTLALANDLAALEALSGTNTIYYRSGTDAWSAVTIGGNMTFSGGTLNSVAGGSGNVSNSGTPTVGQIAVWTDATHIAGASSATVGFGPPQGRLCLVGGPVMTASSSNQVTLYYYTYVGDMVPLYDGAIFTMTSIGSGLTALTTDTTKSPAAIGASKINDWFVWNDAGTIRLGHGPDWTSDTARSAGTALVRINGIWLNDVSITNGPAARRGTYVGTTRSNASSTLDWIFGAVAAGGTAGVFGVWNAYNRVNVTTLVGDSTASWTYATSDFRNVNGSAGNRVSYVAGLVEDGLFAAYSVNTQGTANAAVGIGVDSSTVPSGVRGYTSTTASSAPITSQYVGPSQLGFHFLQAIEWAFASTTFLGQQTTAGDIYVQNGLTFQFRM